MYSSFLYLSAGCSHTTLAAEPKPEAETNGQVAETNGDAEAQNAEEEQAAEGGIPSVRTSLTGPRELTGCAQRPCFP